ncbi:MAG: mandelate racemase/muconate lactonizing enzyme family protein [Gemmatimonadetes bacterium]|nr:mandelate racemase/muconate lactonizing enzyme family protein [Gemmatimonadota bacterium]
MKITELKTTIVCVPFCKLYPWRLGVAHGITVVLVELATDVGLVGIGESPCFFPPAEATKGILDAAAPLLAGEDPFDHERIYRRILVQNGLYYDRVFAGLALSGLDLALWDLMGKATGQPLYKLIGGRVHQVARFISIVPLAEPSLMADTAREVVAAGCKTVYLKYDGDDRALVARLKAVRQAVGPDVKIRVDFNQGLSAGYAVKFLRSLELLDLEAVEQPCGEDDLDGMRYVRQSIGTPVISDESSKTLHRAYATIKAEAADVIQVEPYSSDGIWGARKVCGMAEAGGLPVVFHSVGELGLNQMKLVHLAVSTPNATLDHQTLYDYNSDDVIQGGLMPFDEWTMSPPDRPGLGVELDVDRVREYAACYREGGGLYVTGRTSGTRIRRAVGPAKIVA